MNLVPRTASNLLCACVVVAALSACTSRAVTADELVGDWGAEPRMRDGAGKPWIRLRADGSFDGFDGCSHVSGPWVVGGGGETVTARKVAVVGTACTPDREASFTSMRLDGDQLVYEVASGDTRYMGRRD